MDTNLQDLPEKPQTQLWYMKECSWDFKLLTCCTFSARCRILVTYRYSLLQFTTMHQH